MSVKNAHGQGDGGDKSISAKLFNLTGLRIFQAKFMEELHNNPPKRALESDMRKRPQMELKTVKK